MATLLHFITVGDDLALLIPREFGGVLGARVGATVSAETNGASVTLTPDHEFDRQMTMAREVMAEDRGILHALAQ